MKRTELEHAQRIIANRLEEDHHARTQRRAELGERVGEVLTVVAHASDQPRLQERQQLGGQEVEVAERERGLGGRGGE